LPGFLISLDRYTEAITALYSQNTFHFHGHNDFLAFAHEVNPMSLSQITALTFNLDSILSVWGTPYDHQCPRFTVGFIDGVKPQWACLWSIVAAMENLVSIQVFLEDPGAQEWAGMQCLLPFNELEYLEPLWAVATKLRVFEISVPWFNRWNSPPSQEQSFVQATPFKIIRRGISDISTLYNR
jgi:hypothetical protein